MAEPDDAAAAAGVVVAKAKRAKRAKPMAFLPRRLTKKTCVTPRSLEAQNFTASTIATMSARLFAGVERQKANNKVYSAAHKAEKHRLEEMPSMTLAKIAAGAIAAGKKASAAWRAR